MAKIEITSRKKKSPLALKEIKAKAKIILELLDSKDKDLSILLTDDSSIRKLNHRYLKRNRPTDVLAFSMPRGEGSGDGGLLGDVVISLDTVLRQAGRFRSSFEEEFYLYLVHGILHLVGYRDDLPGERRVMEKLQGKIFKSIFSRKNHTNSRPIDFQTGAQDGGKRQKAVLNR